MARIAATEEAEGIRDEEDVGGATEEVSPGSEADISMKDQDPSNSPQESQPDGSPQPELRSRKGKYVATPQEVHDSFDAVNTLRYSQPAHLSGEDTKSNPLPLVAELTDTRRFTGRCQGLTITPFNAGHTLGGTIWKIRSPAVGTIVYAVNMNHMRERHLDGTVLISGVGGTVFESLARPDLLITDAERANVIGSRRKDRDAALIGMRLSSNSVFPLAHLVFRYHHHHPFFTMLFTSSL
jgi:cleavage and polyadenylation specificity factor subunit 2